jgi:hypothetical protein
MAQPGEARVRQCFRGRAARIVLAAILVAAGAALVIYGVARHSRTVLLKQAEPPAAAEAARVIDEPEPALIREITVGGLRRNPSGKIERTYGEGETPSLCPT